VKVNCLGQFIVVDFGDWSVISNFSLLLLFINKHNKRNLKKTGNIYPWSTLKWTSILVQRLRYCYIFIKKKIQVRSPENTLIKKNSQEIWTKLVSSFQKMWEYPDKNKKKNIEIGKKMWKYSDKNRKKKVEIDTDEII